MDEGKSEKRYQRGIEFVAEILDFSGQETDGHWQRQQDRIVAQGNALHNINNILNIRPTPLPIQFDILAECDVLSVQQFY